MDQRYMNRLFKCLFLMTALALASQAQAEDASKLVAKYNCLGCHAVDKKIVGPSYKEVAARMTACWSSSDRALSTIQRQHSNMVGVSKPCATSSSVIWKS